MIYVYEPGQPVIALVGDDPVELEVGSSYVDDGATALDSEDGNITDSIVVVNNVNTSDVGTYTVQYNVADSDGKAAQEVTRTVYIKDNIKPVITLLGDNPQFIPDDGSYVEHGATASDNYDENLSDGISIDATNVNTDTLGAYTVKYNVTDSSGNIADQVTRNVVVYYSPPTITLTGDSVIYVEVGTGYSDLGATASDFEDGDLTADIITT